LHQLGTAPGDDDEPDNGINARQAAPILRADAPLGPAYSLVYE
jgi:hypothetical protein